MEHIVITGASQGIGAAVARAWAKAFEGSRLSLIARSEEKLNNLVVECADLGSEAYSIPCDLTIPSALKLACDALLEKFGTPSVLVNNAGVFAPGGITDTSFELFDDQIRINLTSAFQMTSLLLPHMLAAGKGHVFFMASVASLKGYPGSIAYCTAKHGLLGLARTIREETRNKGIRVTSLLPGATKTPAWGDIDIPEERFMPAEDIADALISVYQMSDRTVVEEMTLRPQLGDI